MLLEQNPAYSLPSMTHGYKLSGLIFCSISPGFLFPTVFIDTSCEHTLSYLLPLAAVRWQEGHGRRDQQEQLKQAHAAQVKALQDEHRRQQEELMQVRRSGQIIG